MESLRSNNYQAAMSHIRDVLAEIKHEAAWCYDTDSDLPHIAAYFDTLHTACAQIENVPSHKRIELRDALITTIENIINKLSYHINQCVEESTPSRHLSLDEIEHRQRRYGDPDKATPALKVFD